MAPAVSQAQESVAVLGLRAIDGDDALAADLTGALRAAAVAVDGWRLHPAAVSLSQMLLAQGCDEPDTGCIGAIAEDLDATRVIYGTIRRTRARRPFDYALTLELFDRGAGRVVESVSDTVPRNELSADALLTRARRYMIDLRGGAGRLRVQTSTPGAVVWIDDRIVGEADGSGVLVAPDLPPGSHRVRAGLPGQTTVDGTVVVPAGGEASIDLRGTAGEEEEDEDGDGEPDGETLLSHQTGDEGEEDDDGSGGNGAWWVPGGAGLLVGGALAGMTAWSWLKVDGIDGNARWQAARASAPSSVRNICTTTTTPDVSDLCNDADKLETLQWVFAAGAVAGIALGTVLLIVLRPDDAESADAPPPVAVTPVVGIGTAGVMATGRF